MNLSKVLPLIAGAIFLVVVAVKFWPLAVVMALVIIGTLGLQQMSKGKASRATEIRDQLDLETRTLYSGVRRSMFDLEETLEASRSISASKVLITETREELESLRRAVDRAALTRTELKKHLKDRLVLQRETEALQRDIAGSSPETEEKIQTALSAAQAHESTSAQAERAIKAIDGQLESAKVAVQLMRTKFAQGSMEASLAAQDGEDLRNSLAELKAMSRSFDEVEQLGNLSD